MFRKASLGVKIAGILGVVFIFILGFKYIKWILIILGFKLLLELFWKGYKNKQPSKLNLNPRDMVERMRLGAVRGGERFAEGVEVPKPSVSKLMLFILGGVILLIGGSFIFKLISAIFSKLKFLIIIIVALIVLLLISRAKKGRPVTLSKVARRARAVSSKRNPDVEGYTSANGFSMNDRHTDYDEPYRDRPNNRNSKDRQYYYNEQDNYRQGDRRQYRDNPRTNSRNHCVYGRDCEEYNRCRGEYECIYKRPSRRTDNDRRTERMDMGGRD
ncbi:hypothetical protein UT300012_21620 [Paraclostridium bifermentans]